MMENNNFKDCKVALITESLWGMGGANRVLESFLEMFPNADIYALFGDNSKVSDIIRKRDIYYSFLNRIPFIKHIYRYTFFLWPLAIESFDLSEYDIVISSSSSVSHGVITPLGCKHIAYIHSSMRYVWDLKSLYTKAFDFNIFKRMIKEFLVTFNRVWDVSAAYRPDILISNSKFTSKRIRKYWDRDVNYTLTPPVEKYRGKIMVKRKNYYVAGAPFEANKRGDFLLECASMIGFNLKVIGNGSMKKKLERKFSKFPNIEFLGKVSEEYKYDVIANSKGFIVPGVEDYGIFCAEAISCGTPVLAFKNGGSMEIVKENVNGMFFDEWSVGNFKKVFRKFEECIWDYIKISKDTGHINSRDSFKKSIMDILVE